MDQNASTSESAGQSYTRSEDFYFKDGDVVFRVGEVLYRLHSGILRSRIDVFKSLDILEHTHQPPAPREGSDDQHPIVPPQVTSVEWEHLLTLIYKNLGPPPYPAPFLISVLKLASQWGMPESKAWAIEHLQTLADNCDLNAFLHFRLGVQYNLRNSVEGAIYNIFTGTLAHITPPLADLLGFQGYQAVVRQRERHMRQCVQEIIRDLERDVPHSIDCQRREICTLAWQSAWSQRIIKLSSNGRADWMFSLSSVSRFPCPSAMNIECHKLATTDICVSISRAMNDALSRSIDELMEEVNQIPYETLDLTAVAMVLGEE